MWELLRDSGITQDECVIVAKHPNMFVVGSTITNSNLPNQRQAATLDQIGPTNQRRPRPPFFSQRHRESGVCEG